MITTPKVLITIFSLFVSLGCTEVALQHSTAATIQTYADLRYQQVLNNLAIIAWSNDALPSEVEVTDGAVQITDHIEPSIQFGLEGHTPANSSTSLGGSRDTAASWNIKPTNDPVELRRVQKLYKSAVNENQTRGISDKNVPAHSGDDPNRQWLFFGKPGPDAVYSAQYRDVSVYVNKDGLAALSELTIKLLTDKPSKSTIDLQQFRGPALSR